MGLWDVFGRFVVVLWGYFRCGRRGSSVRRLMLYLVNWTDPVEKKRRAPGRLIREEKYPNIAFKSLQVTSWTRATQDLTKKEINKA